MWATTKYSLKGLRKRAKLLPMSPAEREAKRIADARAKRDERRRNKEQIAAKVRLESASCADLAWLKRFVVELPERPGCWLWKGPWRVSHCKPKPLVKRGQYGAMLADRAMWAALERPGLIKKNYLLTTCGDAGCISPDHLYVTNQTLERARAVAGVDAPIDDKREDGLTG